MSVRIRRLAAELQMRRRRLGAYNNGHSWPGKEAALRFELVRYDALLVLAAEMLEVDAPELPERSTLAPEHRAALEDRLAVAGLDVFLAHNGAYDGVLWDGDPCI